MYRDPNDCRVGTTSFNRDLLDVVRIRFNLSNIYGLVKYIGVLLHEISHVISLPYGGHHVENFYMYFAELFGTVYYKIPEYVLKQGVDFDFISWNNTAISEFVIL